MSKLKNILIPFLTVLLVFGSTLPVSALEPEAARTNANSIQDFSSMRLIVSINENELREVDKNYIISSYQPEGTSSPTFLIQYNTEKDCQLAYVYYLTNANFVDVDIDIFFSQEDTDNTMTEDENPLTELNNLDPTVETQLINGEKVVALIDTGVGTADSYDEEHVISRVTVLSNPDNTQGFDDAGHGSSMLRFMIEENPNVRVLSIKALSANGRGTLSSLYSAMIYAIEQNCDVISLSLAAKAAIDEAPAQSFQQAVDLASQKGIKVVAAAGNFASEAKNYIPCALNGVICVGAAKTDGTTASFSNYGEPVVYNVIANSTSEATARTSAIILDKGSNYPSTVLNQDKFFATDFEGLPTDPEYTITLEYAGENLLSHKISDFEPAISYTATDKSGDVSLEINLVKENIVNYSASNTYRIKSITKQSGEVNNMVTDIKDLTATVDLVNVSSDVVLKVEFEVEQIPHIECWDGSFVTDEALCPVKPESHKIDIIGGLPSVTEAPAGTIVTIALNEYDTSSKLFTGWKVNKGSITLSDNTRTIVTFTMPSEDVEIEAEFSTGPLVDNCAVIPYAPEVIDTKVFTTGANPQEIIFGETPSPLPTSNPSSISTVGTYDLYPVEKEGFKFVRFNVEYEKHNGLLTLVALPDTNGARLSYDCATINKIEAIYEPVNPDIPTYKSLTINYVAKYVKSTSTEMGIESGRTINLEASLPDLQDYDFDHWEVVSGDITIADVNSPSTSFVMPKEDVEINAIFKEKIKDQYNINVANSEVELIAPATAKPGDKVTVKSVLPEDLVISQELQTVLDSYLWTYAPFDLEIESSSVEEIVFTMPTADVSLALEIQSHEEEIEDPQPVLYTLSVSENVSFTTENDNTPKTLASLEAGTKVTAVLSDSVTDEELEGWEFSVELTDIEYSNGKRTIKFTMPESNVSISPIIKDIHNPAVCPAEPYEAELENVKIFIDNAEVTKIDNSKPMTLIAIKPEENSTFDHWEIAYTSSADATSSGYALSSNTEETVLTVDCAKITSIKAVFVSIPNPPEPTLKDCGNGVFVPIDQACPAKEKFTVEVVNGYTSIIEAHEGNSVTISYRATSEAYKLEKWTSEDIEFEDPTLTELTFIMPAKNVKIVGNERLNKPPYVCVDYTVKVVNGKINGESEAVLKHCVYGDKTETWTDFKLEALDKPENAVANINYIFDGWQIDDDAAILEPVSEEKYRLISKESPVIITAVFKEQLTPVNPPDDTHRQRKLIILDPITGVKLSEKVCEYDIINGTYETLCQVEIEHKEIQGYTFVDWKIVEGTATLYSASSKTTKVDVKAPEVKIKANVKKAESTNPFAPQNQTTFTTQDSNNRTTVNTGFGSNVAIYSSILLISIATTLYVIKKRFS